MIHKFRRIFSDIGLFFTQHIFINSKDLKERYIEQSFLKKSLIQKKNWIFIPNGINPYFWKKGPNFQIKPYDIIFIGKIDTKPRFEAKALDVLYQSIVKIYQEKQIKLKVLVIGAYDKNLIEVKIPNVDFSFFDFKGIILNRKRLRKYYKKSKIFVLSSRHEGMPNTLMEAMATGIPCIASDVGAVSELIDDNINGLIFTKEDVIQLSEYIIKLLENSILREKLGKNAMEKINKSFSWNKIIRKVEKYYKIIL